VNTDHVTTVCEIGDGGVSDVTFQLIGEIVNTNNKMRVGQGMLTKQAVEFIIL